MNLVVKELIVISDMPKPQNEQYYSIKIEK
jgi:hypothetical protein